jgi:1-acyl-sn-glycerol-3-phosphate acyltransferase
MRAFARLLIRIFFRRVELEGGEHLPPGGPIIVVGNHINGLVDGLLLMATLGRYPRFLGKSTLFAVPLLWPFLKLGGVIPVYRAADGGAGERNRSAFAKCDTILARGGTVALFPEGISHNVSVLQPLRTGAARIALEASAEARVEGIQLVPVGLTYDAKARFRSRALVRIGAPMAVEPWIPAYHQDGREAVRQLTEAVAAALSAVSPTYTSWEEADQVARVAEVMVRPSGQPSGDVALAATSDAAQRLANAGSGPGGWALHEVLAAMADYERDLLLLGLTDAQVAAEYSRRRLRMTLGWSVMKVLAATPFALAGALIHVVPFQVMKQVAKRPPNESIRATVKLLGCFTLFTFTYTALGYVVGTDVGWGFGLLAAVGAPACGYTAVRFAERLARIGGLVEGYRTVKGRRAVIASVRAQRSTVVEAARAVLAAP